MTTERADHHLGLVAFSFYDEDGKLLTSSQSFTRADAAVVYDYLRERYPERAHQRLRTEVVEHLSTRQSATVYSRGLLAQPVRSPEGEPFYAVVDQYGARSRVNAPGVRGVLSVQHTLTEKGAQDVASALRALSAQGPSWRPAAPIDRWSP